MNIIVKNDANFGKKKQPKMNKKYRKQNKNHEKMQKKGWKLS